MSKSIMGFQIIFMFVFFIGVKVEANPISQCMEMIDFKNHMDSFVSLSKEQQLNLACTNITAFFDCVNEVMVEQTGYNLKDLAAALSGTEEGKAIQLMANIEDLFIEMCTEGTELHDDLMSANECNLDKNILKQCEDHAQDALVTFRELQAESGRTLQGIEEPCVIIAYQLGCIGATIREECGVEDFNIYKKILKKIGFFKSGLCSSDLIHTLKTSFLDSLNLTEAGKNVYRVVLDMKKRRK